ncbi:DUF5808 domain-containing protein [Nocardioides iriomotensis]|uniref:DUF5808 domain-containing protein n=1 Tax=Nocardioides iriomotensis TaxID=715784 RepID=A0A4Q5IWI6_9ACTN|nr:DUF5808 domain-containing protein [Nocardioides iriomotensis]RYU09518.1 hypothetical protein ETU37_20945 [Nocardioides iriomotensis]
MTDKKQKRKGRSPVKNLIGLVSLGLLVTAFVKELRTPTETRTWHGELFGVVPYDLRPPTPTRIRQSLWQPESDRLILPRSFGVGWSVNFARVVELANRRTGDDHA